MAIIFHMNEGESNWDWITHYLPWAVNDRSNGDVAADSYHKYKEDVTILKDIGVSYFLLMTNNFFQMEFLINNYVNLQQGKIPANFNLI